jgi:hypothetical protein
VEETDVEFLGSKAALLVNQAAAFGLCVGQCLVGVLYCESDVVHTATAAILLDEFSHGALGASGEQQLNLGFAAFQESGLNFLVSNFFNGVAFQAHDILPVLESFVQVSHCNSDVFNMRRGHFEKI